MSVRLLKKLQFLLILLRYQEHIRLQFLDHIGTLLLLSRTILFLALCLIISNALLIPIKVLCVLQLSQKRLQLLQQNQTQGHK